MCRTFFKPTVITKSPINLPYIYTNLFYGKMKWIFVLIRNPPPPPPHIRQIIHLHYVWPSMWQSPFYVAAYSLCITCPINPWVLFLHFTQKIPFSLRLSLMIIQICQLILWDKLLDGTHAKISMAMINDHLKSENTVLTRELVRKVKNNSLQPVLFKRLDSIRLSCLKYFNTLFTDFFIYRHSFTSLLLFIITKYEKFNK